MNTPPTDHVYGRVAKALHWVIFLLLVIQYIVGWTMPHVGRHTLPVGLIAIHVTVGTLIVLAVAVRILWRLFNRPRTARVASTGPIWSQRVASAVHGLLYVLMLAVPVLGWANANARGWIVGVTDRLSLPAIMAEGSALGHDFGDWHSNLAVVLISLIGLHVAAGLYHHWVLGDGTLRKMW
jgi:cytochrome b561